MNLQIPSRAPVGILVQDDRKGPVAARSFTSDVVEAICKEMVLNANSVTVARIRRGLAEPGTLDLSSPIHPVTRRLVAYGEWAFRVRPSGVWDHKEQIQTTFGLWSYDEKEDFCYLYDIWSNIHYGYVGINAGFDAVTLKNFGGIVQALSNRDVIVNEYTDDSHFFDKTMFIAANLEQLDDASDLAAVDIGIKLAQSRSGELLSATTILDSVRKDAKLTRKKPIQTPPTS